MLTDALRGCISQLHACLGAWQGKMEPNQISLVSRPQCALAVWGEGFRAGCQGWDEALGPAPGDLQSRNMPAKTIFLNLIISHGRRWMQGQSRRYHSQHHHHPHLQMIPVRTVCGSVRVEVYHRNQSQTHETSISLASSIYQLFSLKEIAFRTHLAYTVTLYCAGFFVVLLLFFFTNLGLHFIWKYLYLMYLPKKYWVV